MIAAVSCLLLLLLGSVLRGVAGQCPQRTRIQPGQFLAEVGETARFQCLDDASGGAVVGGARFFKDGVAITIDGSKFARPLTHVLNVNNVGLADEGEYTCLLEDTSCVSDTLTGYLLVEPQVAVNVEQDYTSSVGEDVVLECGLQFGSLRETQYIEWRTRGGMVLVSSDSPGAPGDHYQLNLQTFQLTIEGVTSADEQLSPFGGYICRSGGSNRLSARTNLDATEVYLTVLESSDEGTVTTTTIRPSDMNNVTAGPLVSGEEGLSTGGLAGIIAASLVALALAVAIFGLCLCVVCRMKQRAHKKTRLALPPKSLNSLLGQGSTVVEHTPGTLEKLKSATTSFKGSLFSLSKEYDPSDFELHLEGSNLYVSHKDRNASVSDSWCYSPKQHTLPQSLSNHTSPPNGGIPHYQYEVTTMPLRGQREKTPMPHPHFQHYDTPTKHAVDTGDEDYMNMKSVLNQRGEGEGTTGVENEPGNYEVPISSTEKPREYRSQTPSPEALTEIAEGSSHETGNQEGGVADVLAPPTGFTGADTSMHQENGKMEEGSSESTELDTHEGTTFV